MMKLNAETLDLLENRLIQGMLGEQEVSGTTMEIIRRVLMHNGRLLHQAEGGDPSPYLGEPAEDELPFPGTLQ